MARFVVTIATSAQRVILARTTYTGDLEKRVATDRVVAVFATFAAVSARSIGVRVRALPLQLRPPRFGLPTPAKLHYKT
jgi:hypothetical protein